MRNDSLEQRAASTCIRDSTRLNYELSLGYEFDRTTVCLCLESPEKTRLHRSKYRMKMKNFLHHRSNMVNPVPGRCCCFVPSLSLWPMETAAWNCRQHVISMSPSRSLLLWPLACCWMRAHDPHRHTILFWILDYYYYYCSPAPCPLLQDEGYDYFARMLVCSCPVDLFGGVNPLLVLKGFWWHWSFWPRNVLILCIY